MPGTAATLPSVLERESLFDVAPEAAVGQADVARAISLRHEAASHERIELRIPGRGIRRALARRFATRCQLVEHLTEAVHVVDQVLSGLARGRGNVPDVELELLGGVQVDQGQLRERGTEVGQQDVLQLHIPVRERYWQ